MADLEKVKVEGEDEDEDDTETENDTETEDDTETEEEDGMDLKNQEDTLCDCSLNYHKIAPQSDNTNTDKFVDNCQFLQTFEITFYQADQLFFCLAHHVLLDHK
ncbi:hypothetical protein LXA43DRAFT_1067440 [Ganoderma leucocontextum]|nr:hypothetical protein LXA43DRAFT_1067440 [Ganoderma leucocontextum]